MTHLEEKTIELYVLKSDELGAQRAEVEAHLSECPGCAALHKEISEYYGEVKALQPEEALSEAQALTLRDWIVRADSYKDRVPLRPVRRTVPLRAAIFVTQHPVATTLSFSSLVVAVLLLLFFTKGVKDLNPAYARAKDEFLIAYNKQGQELWKRHFGLGFDYDDRDRNTQGGLPFDQLVNTTDVDADGANEVISLVWGNLTLPGKNKMYCFNSDGSERWRYELHRKMSFGKTAYSDDYLFTRMTVGDFENDGKMEVIAVAHHLPDFPCVVVKVDARSGDLVSEYWHPGYLNALGHMDIDGDGVKEIFLGGVNNAYEKSALAVLDPRRISGHASATGRYIAMGVPQGGEKYYLLFPRNDLQVVAFEKAGTVAEISLTADGLIRIGTGENMGDNRVYGPIYYFDSQMRVVKLLPESEFEALHRRLETEGKLTRKLDDQYYKELRDGVRYWDGERFVHEPTMNKKYNEVAQEKALP